MSTAPASRRERNKARTRQALIDGARELARERGLPHVTAEDVAERAGVSRRTFFNYFTGIESVVAGGLEEPLQRLAAALHRRPAGEDPITAIAAALREHPIGADILLGWATPEQPATLQHQALQLRIWQHHEQWLVGVLRERLGAADDLRVRTLAAAVMACFEVVQHAWLPTAARLAPDDAVAAFNRELLRALDHARRGWQADDTRPPVTRPHPPYLVLPTDSRPAESGPPDSRPADSSPA